MGSSRGGVLLRATRVSLTYLHRPNLRLARTMAALSSNPLLINKALINNEWVGAADGAVFDVTDPATGELLAQVPDMRGADTLAAVSAAKHCLHQGKAKWAESTLTYRAGLLRKLEQLIADNATHLAEIITREQGKPLAESRGEVGYGNQFIHWFAEEAVRIKGDAVVAPHKPNARMTFIRQPVGVCGIITPWNFPLAMITRKAGAALAAGCSVVIKPAEDTPLTALALGKLALDAGIPAGVFNVVTASRANTAEVGSVLCSSPDVDKISFTGSTNVGKILYRQSADTIKRVSLELGGNAPFIVFNSADLDLAVAGAMVSKFRNAGQTCVCANRIFVQSGVYDQFCAKFAQKIKELQCGNGMDPKTSQGPLINPNALVKVKSHIADAVSRGAKVELGGEPHSLGGTFFQPTLLTNVPHDALVNTEETFGPVAAVTKFETEEEVVKAANSVRVGLAGYFYSRDYSQIYRVSERLEVGMVGVNEGLISTDLAPFGGVKESGLGREGSTYGIDEYQEIKYIYVALEN